MRTSAVSPSFSRSSSRTVGAKSASMTAPADRLILCRQRANRAGQSQRRQHPYRIFHCAISAITAEASSTEIARPKRNDPPEQALWRIIWEVEPYGENAARRALRDLLRRRLRAGRNRRNCLQNLRSDLVGVALRVRAAIFEIALIVVLDERVRHADRGAAIGHAIAELVPAGRSRACRSGVCRCPAHRRRCGP